MKMKWRMLRRTVLTLSFMVILINPFLNYYFNFNFVQGWYQSLGIGDLWIVSPLEGVESVLLTRSVYPPLLVGMLMPIILAFTLGRVFCSWICPISFLSEWMEFVRSKVSKNKFFKDFIVFPRYFIWFALIGDMLVALVAGAPFFVFLSPPGLVGREIMMMVFLHTLAIEGIVVIAVLALHLLVTRRFFCRYLCPLGGLLALIGARRRLKVALETRECVQCGLCKKSCPMGLSPEKGEAHLPYCWNCGECVDACKTGSLNFKWMGGSTWLNCAQWRTGSPRQDV